MNPSTFLSVNARDFLKGLGIAVLSAVVAFLGKSIDSGVFTFDFTSIWHVAVASMIAYLGHSFFSGPVDSSIQPNKA